MELHLAAYQLCLPFRLETTTTDGPYHLIFLPLQRTGIFRSNNMTVSNKTCIELKYKIQH
jgi:hypothetical protein